MERCPAIRAASRCRFQIGAMIVARNDAAHENLAEQFRSRNVRKIYLALVHGKMPRDSGSVTLPISDRSDDRGAQRCCTRKSRRAIPVAQRKKNLSGAGPWKDAPRFGQRHAADFRSER